VLCYDVEVGLSINGPTPIPTPTPLLPLHLHLLRDTIVPVRFSRIAVDPTLEYIGSIADSSHTILVVVVVIEC
jgi:hypothetical protein